MLHTRDQNVYAIWQITSLESLFLLLFKHFLRQWVFPTQFWNLDFLSRLHYQQVLHHWATGKASLTVLKIENHYAEHQASLVVQTIKNLPAMWETWVRSLSWEDTLKRGMSTLLSILARRMYVASQATVHGITKSRTRLSNFQMLYTWNLKLQISYKSVFLKNQLDWPNRTKFISTHLFWVFQRGKLPQLVCPRGRRQRWAVRSMKWRFVQIWNKCHCVKT